MEIRANDGTVNSAALPVAITVRANTAPTVSIARNRTATYRQTSLRASHPPVPTSMAIR